MLKAKRKNDEEYGNVYEEYAANAELSTREKNANSKLNNKKLIMKKWCILFVVISFSIGVLVGSLSMYLMRHKDPITTTTSTTTITTKALKTLTTTAISLTTTTTATSLTTTTTATSLTTTTSTTTNPPFAVLVLSSNEPMIVTSQGISIIVQVPVVYYQNRFFFTA